MKRCRVYIAMAVLTTASAVSQASMSPRSAMRTCTEVADREVNAALDRAVNLWAEMHHPTIAPYEHPFSVENGVVTNLLTHLDRLQRQLDAYQVRFETVQRYIDGLRQYAQAVHNANIEVHYGDMLNAYRHPDSEQYRTILHRQAEIRYDHWQLQFVVPARDTLKILLSYAEKADVAQAERARLLLLTTDDTATRKAIVEEASGSNSHAVAVWTLFRLVTEELPDESHYHLTDSMARSVASTTVVRK